MSDKQYDSSSSDDELLFGYVPRKGGTSKKERENSGDTGGRAPPLKRLRTKDEQMMTLGSKADNGKASPSNLSLLVEAIEGSEGNEVCQNLIDLPLSCALTHKKDDVICIPSDSFYDEMVDTFLEQPLGRSKSPLDYARSDEQITVKGDTDPSSESEKKLSDVDKPSKGPELTHNTMGDMDLFDDLFQRPKSSPAGLQAERDVGHCPEKSDHVQTDTTKDGTVPGSLKDSFHQTSPVPLIDEAQVQETLHEQMVRYCGEEAKFLDLNSMLLNDTNFEQTNQATSRQEEFYGLGNRVKEALFNCFNIKDLHEWQHDMLQHHLNVHNGLKNGLLIAPTSGGKTLVAIVLLLRTMLLEQKDTILALPYVAVTVEKVTELSRLAARLGNFTIAEYAGPKGRFPVPRRRGSLRTLYVCTTEKASAIWRFLCKEDQRRQEIGLMVFDEFHMLGDESRGAVLEEFVVSSLFLSGFTLRIFAMSATIGNHEDIARFLGGGNSENCNIFQVKKRPTSISEFAVIMGAAFPIHRNEDGVGHVVHQEDKMQQPGSRTSHPKDIMSMTDVIGEKPLQNEKPAQLWLRINQMKAHISSTIMIRRQNEGMTGRLLFPPVLHIPQYVVDLCRKLRPQEKQAPTRGHPDSDLAGISTQFVDAVLKAASSPAMAAMSWKQHCQNLQHVQDPYQYESTNEKELDYSAYELRLVTNLVEDTLARKESVLIFCNTRMQCVSLCDALTRAHCKLASELIDQDDLLRRERQRIIAHLQEESKGMVHQVLLRGISAGLAFHTAALHVTERKAVEEAFAKGIISVLVCTSTLAAGVNLPASRVIIRSARTGNRQLLTCSKYLQMVGRAGRTNVRKQGARLEGAVEKAMGADSYIFLSPNDVTVFDALLAAHVEPVKSQMLSSSAYYRQTGTLNSNPESRHSLNRYTGISRLLLGLLAVNNEGLKVATAIDSYRLTLLYQSEPDTLEPLRKELMDLITSGYLEMYSTGNQVSIKENDAQDKNNLTDEVRVPPEQAAQLLNEAMEGREEADSIVLRQTTLASAASAGSISLEDAERFTKEAERFEMQMRVKETTTLLYLTAIEDMSRPLFIANSHDPNVMANRILRKMVANYDSHPNRQMMMDVGLTEGKLNAWLAGSPATRANEEFNDKLSRFWAALFASELTAKPAEFENLCQEFGYDRGMAMELCSLLSNRCGNLRLFCQAADKFWWYTAFAAHIIRKLQDACDDDVRPLLVLPHITPDRARFMVDHLKIRTVMDVASVWPPTLLSDNIRHLGTWRAIEVVYHAKMIVQHEALEYAAESRDRRQILQ